MKNLNIIAAIAAAVSLTSSVSFAGEAEMEKCKVVDASGKGLIAAGKSDCKTSKHSCAGQNSAGDAESWISVPTGQCTKINAGDFSGVSPEIKAKVTAETK